MMLALITEEEKEEEKQYFFTRLMKVDSQFPVTLLHLKANADQIIHYIEKC